MAVTIKQIAEMSGISRGTVDRVLNNRGRVNPDKEALIRAIAVKMGYTPNLAGKALAARKKSLVIGVVLPSEGNPFFDDVIQGIRQAEKDLADYGVRVVIRSLKGYDVKRHLAEIDVLAPKVNALILTPMDHPDFIQKINQLMDSGKPVVTMNTDVKNSNRLCYVGSDYRKGGEIACGLLELLTGGKANIAILTGSGDILGHNQRIEGFLHVIEQRNLGFHIIGIAETRDDDETGFKATEALLAEHPETNAAFIVAAGSFGVCKAISTFLADKPILFPVVSFDLVAETREMMRQGIIKATISQQPFVQGFEAVKTTFYYLVNRILPENREFIVKNEINILESL